MNGKFCKITYLLSTLGKLIFSLCHLMKHIYNITISLHTIIFICVIFSTNSISARDAATGRRYDLKIQPRRAENVEPAGIRTWVT